MLTSARNQLAGKVTAVRPGAVNDEIDIALNDQDSIVAIVTTESTRKLELTPGKEVIAIIKASQVMLTTSADIAMSARNLLCGKVTARRNGAVNCEIDVTLSGGGEIVAIITEGSADRLALNIGSDACVFFKASSVIVAIP